jgi:FOG: WD40 repeat
MASTRSFSFTAVLIISWLCCLAILAQSPSSAEAVKRAETAFEETIAFTKKVSATLAEVKDEKSAALAATKLKALQMELDALIERADGIKLDMKSYEEVTAKFNEPLNAEGAELAKQVLRLEKIPELKAAVGRHANRMLIAIIDGVPARPAETIDPKGGTTDADWSLEVAPAAEQKKDAFVLPAMFEGVGLVNRAIALSPDGKWLATTNTVGVYAEKKHAEVRLWDTRTGALTYTLKGYPAEPNEETHLDFLAFTPDGQQIVTSGNRGLLKCWDLKNHKPGLTVKVATLTGYSKIEKATPVAVLPDGRLVAACRAGGIDLVEIASGKKSTAESDPTYYPAAIVVSPDGKRVATFMEDSGNNSMRVWDAEARKPMWTLGDGHVLRTLQFGAKGTTLLAFDHSSFEIKHYDRETGEPKKTIKIQQRLNSVGKLDKKIYGATFVGNDGLIVYHLYGADLYDCATGVSLRVLEDQSYVTDVASSADGSLVALSVHGGTRLIELPHLSAQKDPMATGDKKTKASKRKDPPSEKSSDLRQWKSADGRFSVKAQFEKLADKTVHLEREDGSKIQVPLEKLSKDDQAWVRGKP